MVKVGIINVTGYTGMELARLLVHHPKVELASVTGRSMAGERLGAVFPYLSDIDLTIQSELDDVDLAFSAMPHKASAEVVLGALERGIKVVDLSADFRLNDVRDYESWYGVSHPAPEFLEEAVYGLTELNRSQIASARLVANPGCYPTGAILALAPAAKEGIIAPDIIIDSKSGLSGAGRTLSLATHFSEAGESVSAYALDGHRHLPEIVQELGRIAPWLSPAITFLPHLVPMTRGILTSCYAKLEMWKARVKQKEEILTVYREFYRDEPFVRVVDFPPQTKQARGTNLCLIYLTTDPRTDRLIVVSCLDNLIKGGAGQAIQNMNLMLGFPETMGLEMTAVYP
jgi:N-acetyl-gamma-glutamyl-phosphate reductase